MLAKVTREAQSNLAAYCRTGKRLNEAIVRPERAAVYRRLVYNNLDSTLQSIYPVAFYELQGERWDRMVEDFVANHKIQTPYLWQMPREFLNFAQACRFDRQFRLPYLLELLEFEWVEVEVHMMPDTPIPLFLEEGDLLTSGLVLNPEHLLLALRYPVFKVPPRDLSGLEGRYFVVTFRHPQTKQVEFIELSPLFALVVERLAKEKMTGQALLDYAAKAFQKVEQRQLRQAGLDFFQLLSERGLLLGTTQQRELAKL